MPHFGHFEIPRALRSTHQVEDDVNIIIGENGSGKSTLLGDIANHFTHFEDFKVIAIANTIYDKFAAKGPNFEVLRASQGKSLIRKTISKTFRTLANTDLKRLRNIARTLEYVNFEPRIGLLLNGLDEHFESKLFNSSLNLEERGNLAYFLNRYSEELFGTGEILKVNLDDHGFNDLKNSILIQVFLYEKQLKSLGLIKSLEVFLFKSGLPVPIKKASSGELTVITSLLFLTINITERAVVLIDEPENSLHPKWQTEYVRLISDLFYLYQPKIIIATHSPLIINGAELSSKKVNVFKGEEGRFIKQSRELNNVEEIYQDYFDLTTPKNRYISEIVVEKMNLLAAGKIGFGKYREFITELKSNSYDESQKVVFDDLIGMGEKIIRSR